MIRVIALCVIFLLAALGPLAAAETARVRVGAHEPAGKDPFGRIVFEWPSPVEYKAEVESGRLVVRFARPVAARLDMVARYLDDYVSDAVIEEEGRVVAFALKSNFVLKSYADGATIVLDLLRTDPLPAKATPRPAAAPPVQPVVKAPPASVPASGTPSLAVRSGEHPGFSRLVFDWTRNVEYTVVQDGSRVTVRFDQPARIDYAALSDHLPKSIVSVEPAVGEGGAGLQLGLASPARLRHFRSGTRVVLDILDPPGGPAGKPAAVAASQPAPAPSAAPAPQPARVAGAAVAPKAEPPAVAAPKSLLPNRQGDGKADAAQSSASGPSSASGQSSASDKSSASAVPSLATDAIGPATPSPEAAVLPKVEANRPSEPSAAANALNQLVPGPNTAAVDIPSTRLMVQPMGTINELSGVRFVWPQEVGAAIYERSGFLWLIFDRRAAVEVVGAWPRDVVKPQQVPNVTPGDVTILRWPAPAGKFPGLRRDGKDWVVDLKKAESKPVTDIKPETQVAVAAGGRVLLRGSDFGAVRAWRDPEVGDRIWVIPIAKPGHGSAVERHLAEVHFMATLQGVVISPSSDDVTVRNVPEGIEVSMPGGLNLSGNNVMAAKPAGRTPITAFATAPSRLFDFDAWDTPTGVNFFDHKRDLLSAVIDASGPSRNKARLALAQFYFSHGYITEALGVLQVLVDEDANAVKDPAFRSLRGASYYLRGDYPLAGADLFHNSLDGERDIALWRGVLLASQNDWGAAAQYFNQADQVLRSYPREYLLKISLLAAEAALMTGDIGVAKFHTDYLASLKPEPMWVDQINYFKGRLLAKMNDADGAVGAWESAMAGVHRPTKVKARYSRVETLLADNRMSPADAIGEMELLRFAWRGDEIELKVLKMLGELYIDTADYRNGLMTLHEAAVNYPLSPDAQSIGDKMRAAFAALYLNGEADKLTPLSALSLYDDFQDLTPAGDAGNVVVSKLVDRLVSVELLDRAAAVLKDQVDTRLKGAALADGLNRLGVIHLLSRRPEEALTVLNRRLPPEASPTTVIQRRQLLARTFGELARYKEALALLEGDASSDADRLRAEIGWRTQNWKLATTAFAKLVPAANKPFADSDRQTVLRLAIAQSLSNNPAGLRELRQTYGPAMAQSAYKESFEMITAPGTSASVDLRAIARQVSSDDQFRAFITSYRDKLLTHKDPGAKPGAGQAAQVNG